MRSMGLGLLNFRVGFELQFDSKRAGCERRKTERSEVNPTPSVTCQRPSYPTQDLPPVLSNLHHDRPTGHGIAQTIGADPGFPLIWELHAIAALSIHASQKNPSAPPVDFQKHRIGSFADFFPSDPSPSDPTRQWGGQTAPMTKAALTGPLLHGGIRKTRLQGGLPVGFEQKKREVLGRAGRR